MSFYTSVHAPINFEDYTVEPFTVNKSYTILSASALEQGYTIRQGYYDKKIVPISSSKANVFSTNADGTYRSIIWKSLNHLYYQGGHSPLDVFEGTDRNNTSKFYFITSSIITCPHLDYGEAIKTRSCFLTGSSFELRDDGYNNLYDYRLNTSSFLDPSNLVVHLGFEDLYKFTRRGQGSNISTTTHFTSNVIEQPEIEYFNVGISQGVQVNGTGSGREVDFIGNSHILIPHLDEFNFEQSEDFTISFWLKAPVTQSVQTAITNNVCNKNEVQYVLEKGYFEKLNSNNQIVRTRYTSGSYKNVVTPVYPWRFDFYNSTAGTGSSGKILFSRSDGKVTLVLTSSTDISGEYHHVAVTKSGSLFSLYVDGALESTGSDTPKECLNLHSAFIGSGNLNHKEQLSGSLDEFRIYNFAASAVQITGSLADNIHGGLYQTANVGNVFYRAGNIIITSPMEKYHNILDQNWSLLYRNTFTIYEHEVVVRIKKNLYSNSLNPTLRKSPKSTEYLDSVISGSMPVYATTIGLYNSKNELLAVGKFGTALKMRDDVDINVIMRWDA